MPVKPWEVGNSGGPTSSIFDTNNSNNWDNLFSESTGNNNQVANGSVLNNGLNNPSTNSYMGGLGSGGMASGGMFSSPYNSYGMGQNSYSSPYSNYGMGGTMNGGYGGGMGSSMYGGGGMFGGGSSMYGNSMYGSGMYGGNSMYNRGGYGGYNNNMGMYGNNMDPNMQGQGQQQPQGPPPAWQRFMMLLNGVVGFFGKVSFLVDENVQAIHFFISAMLQLLDRAGTLYGELARFLLRLLLRNSQKKQQAMVPVQNQQIQQGQQMQQGGQMQNFGGFSGGQNQRNGVGLDRAWGNQNNIGVNQPIVTFPRSETSINSEKQSTVPQPTTSTTNNTESTAKPWDRLWK